MVRSNVFSSHLLIRVILCAMLFSLANLGFAETPLPENQPVSRRHFIENKGQWDSSIKYLVRANGLDAWITNSGLVCDFYNTRINSFDKNKLAPARIEPKNISRIGHVINISLQGGSESAFFSGAEKSETTNNFFIGNDPAKWASDVPLFSEVTARDVYPLIDMRYYFDEEGLRYDFLLKPGARVENIRLLFEGSDGVEITDAGELLIHTSLGDVFNKKLQAYQVINGVRKNIACRFKITDGAVTFSFTSVDEIDPSQPLIIDPLIYSTYLGEPECLGYGLAVDSEGCAYVTGIVRSFNFPVTIGSYDNTYNLQGDIYITKMNPQGNGLVYSTYIGGTNQEGAYALSLGSDNSVYVAGETSSADFPVSAGAFSPAFSAVFDAVVLRLNPQGNALMYASYLGGSLYDYVYGITNDEQGNAYVAGYTASPDFPFTAGAFDTQQNLMADAFVAKVNPEGTELVYSTFLGGDKEEYATSIALGAGNTVYVCGMTGSRNFPVTAAAFDTSHQEYIGYDGFVSKLSADGSFLFYSTFLGGYAYDYLLGIDVGSDGCAYVTGYTDSWDYPVTPNPFQDEIDFGGTSILSKLDPAGSALVYSTFFGGGYYDVASAITLAWDESVFISGWTASGDFPVTPDAFDGTPNGGLGGGGDAFIVHFNQFGNGIYYGTYLGGANNEWGNAIKLGPDGSVYIHGYTVSGDFPTSPGAFDEYNQDGGITSYVTRLNIGFTDVNDESGSPEEFALFQNYPNPFNPSTNISFSLPQEQEVLLIIYNALGEEISRLIDSQLYSAGTHRLSFDGSRFASGIYFCRLITPSQSLVQKMILMK